MSVCIVAYPHIADAESSVKDIIDWRMDEFDRMLIEDLYKGIKEAAIQGADKYCTGMRKKRWIRIKATPKDAETIEVLDSIKQPKDGNQNNEAADRTIPLCNRITLHLKMARPIRTRDLPRDELLKHRLGLLTILDTERRPSPPSDIWNPTGDAGGQNDENDDGTWGKSVSVGIPEPSPTRDMAESDPAQQMPMPRREGETQTQTAQEAAAHTSGSPPQPIFATFKEEVEARRYWDRIWKQMQEQRFDQSPFIPKTFEEWVEFMQMKGIRTWLPPNGGNGKSRATEEKRETSFSGTSEREDNDLGSSVPRSELQRFMWHNGIGDLTPSKLAPGSPKWKNEGNVKYNLGANTGTGTGTNTSYDAGTQSAKKPRVQPRQKPALSPTAVSNLKSIWAGDIAADPDSNWPSGEELKRANRFSKHHRGTVLPAPASSQQQSQPESQGNGKLTPAPELDSNELNDTTCSFVEGL